MSKCDQVYEVCDRCGARQNWNPNKCGEQDAYPLRSWATMTITPFDQCGLKMTEAHDRQHITTLTLCGECMKPIRKAVHSEDALTERQRVGRELYVAEDVADNGAPAW